MLGEQCRHLLKLPAVASSGLASGHSKKSAGHGSPGPQAVVRSFLRLPVVRRDAAKSRFYATERMQMRFGEDAGQPTLGTTQQE